MPRRPPRNWREMEAELRLVKATAAKIEAEALAIMRTRMPKPVRDALLTIAALAAKVREG